MQPTPVPTSTKAATYVYFLRGRLTSLLANHSSRRSVCPEADTPSSNIYMIYNYLVCVWLVIGAAHVALTSRAPRGKGGGEPPRRGGQPRRRAGTRHWLTVLLRNYMPSVKDLKERDEVARERQQAQAGEERKDGDKKAD
eukprot:519116-Prorocentrum_minimum.AAC.1